MRKVIVENGMLSLYHFTDIEQLSSIAENGLLTKEDLENKGLLSKVRTGGNTLSKNLDKYHGNWDKVSLSWCPKLPMAYYREQEQHLCYLVIEQDLCLMNGVYFTSANATQNGHQRNQGLAGLGLIDWRSIKSSFPYPSTEVKNKKQSEILVPFNIDTGFIKLVVFRSDSSLQYGKRLCAEYPSFIRKFIFNSVCFILPSPYTSKHILTMDKITEDGIQSWNFSCATNLSKGEELNIVALFSKLNKSTTVRIEENNSAIYEGLLNSSGTAYFSYPYIPRQRGKVELRCLLKGTSDWITQFSEEITVN